MLSYNYINSHSQVSDPRPKDPLVKKIFQEYHQRVKQFVSGVGPTFFAGSADDKSPLFSLFIVTKHYCRYPIL